MDGYVNLISEAAQSFQLLMFEERVVGSEKDKMIRQKAIETLRKLNKVTSYEKSRKLVCA